MVDCSKVRRESDDGKRIKFNSPGTNNYDEKNNKNGVMGSQLGGIT
jgi:hypothetical protein